MAPSGPRSQRNQRISSAPAKATGRPSGIRKRGSSGPVKTDRDGDLDMDAPAGTGGAGRSKRQSKGVSAGSAPPTGPRHSMRTTVAGGRAPKPTTRAADMVRKVIENGSGSISSRISAGLDTSSRHTRSSKPVNAANTMVLKIGGLKNSQAASNEGGGLRELVIFLERKAAIVGKLNRAVRIKKSHIRDDYVYITASVEDAEEIKKLQNFQFAGAAISVEESTEGLSNTSQEIKTRLSGVLSQRYHSDTKLLNLSDLGQDTTLQEMDMLNKASPEKLFRALMVIVEENFKTAHAKREGVISISLAGNNIDDVQQIMPLADTFPDLLNLDLSRNQFKDLNGLRRWSHRFRKLETLFLQGNPIAADTSYMVEVTKWFPKLQNLSETQVRTKEEILAAQQAPKVTPIPQCGSDFRDVNQIGEAFITEFFAMFDNDRQNLAAKYYDEQSTFSFSVMTSANHVPDTPAPSWGQYIRLSRNHVKINHQSARYQRLFVGTSLVQNAWAKIPPTQHPNLSIQFDKYLIDCHPLTGLADPTGQSLGGVDGMGITMHGEFDDLEPTTNKTTKRSFSRSFILGPGKPGRNPIRVVSDMWQLRAYSPLPAQTGPLPQTAALETAPTNPEAHKEQMAMELCKQTGMALEYSKMCLDVAGWNFDQALVTFNEKRAQLPAEAFAQATM